MDLASSPKSVFRAARKFRLQTLRDLAMRAINEQITPNNCLAELFGLFTLRYQEVFEKRLDYVFAHWNQIEAGQRGNILQLLTTSRNRAKAREAFNMIMARTLIG